MHLVFNKMLVPSTQHRFSHVFFNNLKLFVLWLPGLYLTPYILWLHFSICNVPGLREGRHLNLTFYIYGNKIVRNRSFQLIFVKNSRNNNRLKKPKFIHLRFYIDVYIFFVIFWGMLMKCIILCYGIPEASGQCGSIRLVKVVWGKPARTHNISTGNKITKRA